MSCWTLFPLVAFSVNIFVWIYVFAQQKRDPINLAFLLSTACGIGWLGTELLFYHPISIGNEELIFKLLSIFWIPSGFWFLFFAYALLGKTRDMVMLIAGLASLFGIGVTIFTDAIVLGHSHMYWGTSYRLDPVYQPLLATITAVTGAYGVVLVLRRRRYSSDPLEKKALGLLVYGTIAVMGAIAVMNVFLPALFPESSFPRFGSSAFTVFILFVFMAITRYRFLSISLEKVAEELFQDINDGILLVDRANRVQRSNLAARHLIGESLEGKDVRILFTEQDMRNDFVDQVVHRREGNKERFLALSSSTTSREGDVIGKILIVRDITEQKRAEAVLRRSKEELEQIVAERTEQLKHAQRMEAIGTLAGAIAHDFNNILAAVLGFANAARGDLSQNSPLASDLDEIIVAGNRGREIVRQMLTISRKRNVAEFLPVDVGDIIKETIELAKVSIPDVISVKTAFDPVPAIVLCDATQISQVLMNLLNNSVHAMKDMPTGELTVGFERITIDQTLATALSQLKIGEGVRIFVTDTGIGIPPNSLAQIFNPFFTTKPRGEGTGLGLASTFVIVNNHDGDIKVQSKVDKGTTVSVYLPILDGETTECKGSGIRVSEMPPHVSSRGATILLVDDEPQMLKVGRRILGQLGYTVVTATDGEDALNQMREDSSRFHLMVTDYSMPKKNGIALVRALRAEGYGLPVIMMSGYGDAVSREDIESSGVAAFLQKPVQRSLFSKTIRRLLDEGG